MESALQYFQKQAGVRDLHRYVMPQDLHETHLRQYDRALRRSPSFRKGKASGRLQGAALAVGGLAAGAYGLKKLKERREQAQSY